MVRLRWFPAALPIVAFVACAQTDLGSPCHLLTTANVEVLPRPHRDVVQSGNGECQEFACVSFSGTPATCSSPCDQEGLPCGNGYVCRATLLTPQLLQTLRTATEGHFTGTNTLDDFQILTSGLTNSLFCGPKP